MTPQEHLDQIQTKLDYVATLQRSHDEQIGRLVEQADRSDRRLDVLTERTIQAMEAVNQLARIVGIHEDRIDDLENRAQ